MICNIASIQPFFIPLYMYTSFTITNFYNSTLVEFLIKRYKIYYAITNIDLRVFHLILFETDIKNTITFFWVKGSHSHRDYPSCTWRVDYLRQRIGGPGQAERWNDEESLKEQG